LTVYVGNLAWTEPEDLLILGAPIFQVLLRACARRPDEEHPQGGGTPNAKPADTGDREFCGDAFRPHDGAFIKTGASSAICKRFADFVGIGLRTFQELICRTPI
jgi:hypothetical protein